MTHLTDDDLTAILHQSKQHWYAPRLSPARSHVAALVEEVRRLRKERDGAQRSDCCGAPVKVGGSDEGTNYFYCGECGEPCDVAEENTNG